MRARLVCEGKGGLVEEGEKGEKGEKVSNFLDADRDVKMMNVAFV